MKIMILCSNGEFVTDKKDASEIIKLEVCESLDHLVASLA